MYVNLYTRNFIFDLSELSVTVKRQSHTLHTPVGEECWGVKVGSRVLISLPSSFLSLAITTSITVRTHNPVLHHRHPWAEEQKWKCSPLSLLGFIHSSFKILEEMEYHEVIDYIVYRPRFVSISGADCTYEGGMSRVDIARVAYM